MEATELIGRTNKVAQWGSIGVSNSCDASLTKQLLYVLF
jgi:hypothetical protein